MRPRGPYAPIHDHCEDLSIQDPSPAMFETAAQFQASIPAWLLSGRRIGGDTALIALLHFFLLVSPRKSCQAASTILPVQQKGAALASTAINLRARTTDT